VSFEPELRRGWVGEELAAEFPQLALLHTTLAARPRRTPVEVRERLRAMSDRFTGSRAVQVRRQPVPWAYRVFFRQIGIDPDARRTPAEAAAVERMLAGTFASRNLVDDALTIAVVETGVPVVAFDADRLDGEPGLRLAVAGERLGGEGRDLRGGEIVLADERRPLAILFGEISERRGVGPDTERMLLVAIRVKGVPDVSVEEALWTASETLRSTS
jgi:DNA/RNA-binding domain of Phe-tRNA-synthetase-like protein